MSFDNTPPVAITGTFSAAFNNTAPVKMVAPFLVRVASSGASGPATDEIVAGDTIDGVEVAEGDRILRYATNDNRDGVFVIGASSTIAAPEADGETEMPEYVKALEGTTKHGKVFSLAADWPDVIATEMSPTPVTMDSSPFSKGGAVPITLT